MFKKIVYILIFICGITSYGFCEDEYDHDQPPIVFGYYKEYPIEYRNGNYFAHTIPKIGYYIRNNDIGQDVDPAFQVRLIWQTTFDETATHAVLVDEAILAGYTVDDTEIDTMMETYPNCLDENGVFQPLLFAQIPSKEMSVIREYAKELLLVSKFIKDHPLNEDLQEMIELKKQDYLTDNFAEVFLEAMYQ